MIETKTEANSEESEQKRILGCKSTRKKLKVNQNGVERTENHEAETAKKSGCKNRWRKQDPDLMIEATAASVHRSQTLGYQIKSCEEDQERLEEKRQGHNGSKISHIKDLLCFKMEQLKPLQLGNGKRVMWRTI
jgi:hypothetical protein